MTGPNIPVEEPISVDLGQADERSKRVKKRETMAKIEEQYQNLSRSIESKFGDLNKSIDSVNEKFGKLVEQQGKISKIFNKNSTAIDNLKQKLDEKDAKIANLEEQMISMSSRLDLCEEKYGETETQFLLHSEMLCQQNDKFEQLAHDAKSHTLIVKKHYRNREIAQRGY